MGGRTVVEWVERRGTMLAIGILGVVAVSLLVLLVRRPEPPRVIVQQAAQPAETGLDGSSQIAALVVVHLSGEVIAPGVYRLPVGARIDDALKAAGGPTGDGDIHRLNLAARLADGQQIVVPRHGDPRLAGPGDVASPAPDVVNVNTASVAELERLPGIGPVTAQRIVTYREQHGPFPDVEELRQAKLVNASTFAKIKDLIRS